MLGERSELEAKPRRDGGPGASTSGRHWSCRSRAVYSYIVCHARRRGKPSHATKQWDAAGRTQPFLRAPKVRIARLVMEFASTLAEIFWRLWPHIVAAVSLLCMVVASAHLVMYKKDT